MELFSQKTGVTSLSLIGGTQMQEGVCCFRNWSISTHVSVAQMSSGGAAQAGRLSLARPAVYFTSSTRWKTSVWNSSKCSFWTKPTGARLRAFICHSCVLNSVHYFRLLSMGFETSISNILTKLPKQRRTYALRFFLCFFVFCLFLYSFFQFVMSVCVHWHVRV